MKFGSPIWLVLLPILVGVGFAWFMWSQRQRRRTLATALATPLLAQLVASLDPRRRWLKYGVLLAGVAGLAFALARPQYGHEAVQVERTGIDLMVALDVSRSMLVTDVDGTNRLAAAQAALRNLLHHLGGDRVGLVAFAGEAFLVVPLTRDQAVVERALDSLKPELISEPGTQVAKAIKRAQESFDRGSEGPRALLVISDGEQMQGDAVSAAREAARDRIRVHTAGVGSNAGGRVPRSASPWSDPVKNALGREVISRLNERTLRESARAGQGLCVKLNGRDSHELVTWFEQAAAGLPRTTESRQLGDPREWYQGPLLVALVLLALEWGLSERRRSRGLSRSLGGGSRSTGFQPVVCAGNPQGRQDACATSGTTSTAAPALLAVMLLPFPTNAAEDAAKPDPWAEYNRGVTAYARGEFLQAEDLWLDLTREKLPRRLQPAAWFQIGNAEFRLGEPLEASAPEQALESWHRSREAYRSTLSLQRRHAGAQHNLALVEKRLAQVNHRLGLELRERAENQKLDTGIDLLRMAVGHLREAVELAPKDEAIRRDSESAERRLRERLMERAQQAEQRGDEAAKQDRSWSDAEAEREYRSALADLAEARTEPASSDPSRPAAERVTRKLTDLLTRMGKREQQSGEANAPNNPQEALDHFDQALEHYAAAQQVDPANAAAQRGEKEVRAAMERLHVQEGKRNLARGIEATPNNVPVAARELSAALSHFDTALELNPQNADAAQGAAEARRRLPDVLARLGQSQQQSAEQAESQSPAAALPLYEEAETSYRDALALDAQHQPAQKGLSEVEERMAKLRQQMQQAAQQANGKPQNAAKKLDQLLGEVQDPWRERQREEERQRQASRNDARPRQVYPDW
jgi:Ca-activated chloride channel family protein